MYYIYELWDSINNIPIYVGYGKHNRKGSPRQRHEDHEFLARKYQEGKLHCDYKYNLYKLNVICKVLKLGGKITYKFPYEQLTMKEAHIKETECILKYGRRDLGTGPLTNLDSGGRGGRIASAETRKKISDSKKGKESPLKGRLLGPYDQDRKEAIGNGIRKYILENPEKHSKQRSEATKGRELTEDHKQKISETLKGRPSPMKGKKSNRKGMTNAEYFGEEKSKELSEKLSKSLIGRTAPNKGKESPHRGKTYEEIYGKEKAEEMKRLRTMYKWVNNGTTEQKVNKSELDSWINQGWKCGRTFKRK